MRTRSLLALVLVGTLLVPGVAMAAIQGSPDLSAHLSDNHVSPGEETTLGITLQNSGNVTSGSAANPSLNKEVTTARAVTLDLGSGDAPISVNTGTRAIGSVQGGAATQPVEFGIEVDDDAEPGNYRVPVTVRYDYTDFISANQNIRDHESTQERLYVTLRVTDQANFEIHNVTTDAQVGDQGTLVAEVENVGGEAAHDAAVTLESGSAGLTFGESAQDTARIDRLEPGETTEVVFDAGFASSAPVRDYVLDGTVSFETVAGHSRVDEDPSASVRPAGEQRFSIEDVEADLYVGEKGEVRGVITNEGPATANNVGVQYVEDSSNLIPVTESVAVGTLEAGESTDFRLPIDVGKEAGAVTHTADVAVQYRNDEFEPRSYQDVELMFDVAGERDRFDLELANRTIESGGSRSLSVDVTNNLNETVSEVEARMFAEDPIDTGDTDTGYSQAIEPGETVTMTFDVTAASSAKVGSTYPISFDFRYTDGDGNTHLSDTLREPLDAVEPDNSGGGPPIALILVVGVVVVGVAAVVYRRQ